MVNVEAAGKRTKAQSAKLDRLILAWKRAYVRLAKIKPVVELARGDVAKLLQETGGEPFESKHGKVSFRTPTNTDWQALARSALKPEFIDQMLPMFTKQGEPY